VPWRPTVSGVVRDAQGVAQLGAMVEVLAAGSATVATAFTDLSGRYRIANLAPGKYQLRASAPLFMPATRRNLQLATGMRATVNLTLSTLADAVTWLPVQGAGRMSRTMSGPGRCVPRQTVRSCDWWTAAMLCLIRPDQKKLRVLFRSQRAPRWWAAMAALAAVASKT